MKTDARIFTAGIALLAMLLAGPASAERKAGDWIGRVGMSDIDPKQNNGDLDLYKTGLGGGLESYQIDVDDDTQVSFTGVYMITDNIGVELLASLPFEHDVNVGGVKIGSTKHLPPTLSAQWHFNPAGEVHPYLGAGLNYTTFFSENANGADVGTITGIPGFDGATVTNFELDDSWGIAVQAGVDFEISERMMINFDVRYVNIESEVTKLKVDPVGTVNKDLGSVDIDPVIITLALGYKF